MAMQIIRKTSEYRILKRGDGRYAVKDAEKQPVNGDEKVAILLKEGLITVTEPSAPSEEPAAEESAEASEEGGE